MSTTLLNRDHPYNVVLHVYPEAAPSLARSNSPGNPLHPHEANPASHDLIHLQKIGIRLSYASSVRITSDHIRLSPLEVDLCLIPQVFRLARAIVVATFLQGLPEFEQVSGVLNWHTLSVKLVDLH